MSPGDTSIAAAIDEADRTALERLSAELQLRVVEVQLNNAESICSREHVVIRSKHGRRDRVS